MADNGGDADAGNPGPVLERLVASTQALQISAEALQTSVDSLKRSSEVSEREYNQVYLRIRGRNQDRDQYFEAWLSEFMGGNQGELPGGNVNWPALKTWIVASINAAVGQRVKLGEIQETVVYVLNLRESEARAEMDQMRLITLLVAWKQSGKYLYTHRGNGMPCIEFESTKLLGREGGLVLPSIEVDTPMELDTPSRPSTKRTASNSLLSQRSKKRGKKRTATTESLLSQRSKKRTRTKTRTPTPTPHPGHGAGAGDEDAEDEEDEEDDYDPAAGENEEDYNRGPSETPIADAEADKRSRVLQVISREDNSRKLDDDEHWQKVRAFFLKDYIVVENFMLPGLQRPFDCYQAAAAVWILTRYPEQGIAGPILADDPGVGKTLTMIIAIILHNNLQEAFGDVKAFWKNNKRRGLKHNPKNARKDVACPSQVEIKRLYGIQCPCVAGSTSRGIVDHMWNWPSIVICLGQDGVTNWLAEWKKTVDPQEYRVKVYVNITGWEDKSDLAAFCKAIKDAPDPEDTQALEGDRFAKSKCGFVGGSRHVLLSPTTQTGNLIEPKGNNGFLRIRSVRINKRKTETFVMPISGCAILALDEMQNYKGTPGNKTQPYQLLEILGKQQNKPTLAVGISGSIGSLGLKSVRHLLAYTLLQGHQYRLDRQLGRLGNMGNISGVDSDWDYLKDHPEGVGAEPVKYADALAKLQNDWNQGLSKMLVRRSQTDTFRGQKIVTIPKPLYKTIPLEMQPGAALSELHEYSRLVRRAMLDYHRRMLASADEKIEKERKEKGTSSVKRPSLLESQQRVLKQLPRTASEENPEALNRCFLATTFPGIALFAKESPNLLPYLKNEREQAGLAKAFTRATFNPEFTRRQAMQKVRENNPFWDIATTKLLPDAPKAEHLCHLVHEELIKTRSDRNGQAGKAPADGSGVRHMIVFVNSPITAYLMALILFQQFEENVDVFLIHSGLPTAPRATEPWHCRQSFEETFNSSCEQRDNNKIAVITYNMGSTGWNLQRANIAVLLDVPVQKAERDQACNRVNRRGQRCEPHIHEMHYTNHFCEDWRKLVNDGKQKSEIDWNKWGVNVQEEEEKERREEVRRGKQKEVNNG
ncbi:hypothetical protein PG993_012665 [Apiospora rasikravindrae]|uniref:Helicase C-terminal domain-containing protein n=1 Tax=Apiospora rasikravindrae TaxID=990691 RepID=A0ABR1S345_9PEZI